ERECDTITRAKPGRKTPTLQITGIDNTNSESATDANDLAEALTEGSNWYAVRRRGKAFDEPFAAADVVAVTQFDTGVGSEVSAEANSVLRTLWNTFVNAHEPKAVVAAGSSPPPTPGPPVLTRGGRARSSASSASGDNHAPEHQAPPQAGPVLRGPSCGAAGHCRREGADRGEEGQRRSRGLEGCARRQEGARAGQGCRRRDRA